jgi:hypothetical protein
METAATVTTFEWLVVLELAAIILLLLVRR